MGLSVNVTDPNIVNERIRKAAQPHTFGEGHSHSEESIRKAISNYKEATGVDLDAAVSIALAEANKDEQKPPFFDE